MTAPATRPLVLIADDHDDGRQMYAGYLKVNGFRTVEARDGDEAVRLAIDLRPAVIVLDLMMPRVDGITAILRLRRHAELRDVPVLVVTAYDTHEQRALEAGATAVCVKPCAPLTLLKQVLELARVAG